MNYDARSDAPGFGNTETMWNLVITGLARGIAQCSSVGYPPPHVERLIKECCHSVRSFFPANPALSAEVLGEHLFKAVEGGRIGAIELLVQAGANVNWMSADGITPLTVALKSRRFDILNWLVRAGATEGASQRTYDHAAVSIEEKRSILGVLIECRQVESVIQILTTEQFSAAELAEPLRDAVLKADMRMMEALVAAGADVLGKVGHLSIAEHITEDFDAPIRFDSEAQKLFRSLVAEANTARALSGQAQSPAPASGSGQKPGPLQSLGAVGANLSAPATNTLPTGTSKPSSPSPL
jgi:hypothetical protein